MYVMSQNTVDQFDLPPELCAKPLALVGLSGLDTVNNAIHKSIWETFSSNKRIERCPITFKLIDNAHEFPVVKPKRNSYEWYLPKGILKKNWINKHLKEIPAVIVIFYDLDWNDGQWNEKVIECASRVQSMRAALEGRNSKIVIVLIQNVPPLPACEDILASERAVALCATCELTAKSLYVLPHDDHLQGYAVRLENAFYDLAQNYYHTEIRHIKSHREHLNKNNHQYLIVRHQFKMGFLNELRQDNHTAHKHYTHAYNNLLEIRIVDTNATKIRTVAGYINYKLCRLMFSINTPRDAISQFRAHTDRFKQRLGFQELAFEHYAWISKQFSIFGDIFDEAVKQGLPAVQTQHPGIYYYQAAQYMITRKKLSGEICNNVTSYPQPDPLSDANTIEFYGQRPWKRGKDSADVQVENSGIQALQFNEKQFNHSAAITTLYGMAISQYKTYRCPRMRRHLVIQMADEYYNSHDYGKALTLLLHMLWDYRTEKWWYIIANILEKALKCAYLTASIQDYVCVCLELLGTNVPVSLTCKKRIFENMMRLLKKQVPEPEPGTNPSKDTDSLWKTIVIKDTLNVALDLRNVISCIDCKAKFSKLKYEADEKVILELFIKLSSPFPLSFSCISAIICTPGVNSEFKIKELNSNSTILFKPNEIKCFTVEFVPDPNDVEKEIQLDSINLTLGNLQDTNLNIKLTGIGNDLHNICQELLHFKLSKSLDFDNIKAQITTKLVPYNSKLNVKFEHPQPALSEEWYKVSIIITNEEVCSLKDINFELSLVDDVGLDNTEFSLDLLKTIDKLPIKLSLPNLAPANNQNITFYIKAYTIGDRNLSVKFSSVMEREKCIASVKAEELKIPVIKPFEITTNFISYMYEEITKFYVGEKFILMPTITCLSPTPIVIEDTTLNFEKHIGNNGKSIKKQIAGNTLKNDEAVTEMFVITAKKQSEQNINIGQYTIKWRRPKGNIVTSQVSITGYPVHWIPLDLSLSLPAHGFVRTPVIIKYNLYNRSHQLIQLDINMDASDGFMYAGYKQYQISILPESIKELEYNLYPLIAGNVALPKLILTVPENSTEGPALRQEQVNELVERALPTHFFVMPQTKGQPNVSKIGDLLNKQLD